MDQPKGQGDTTPEITPEAWAKVQEQLGNLNKGIASARDEVNNYKTKSEALEKELNEFKSKIEFNSDDDEEVKLAPEDQKKLEEWARQKGFVTSAELETEKGKIQQESLKIVESQAIADFLEKHKEYEKDEEWAKVQAEFQLYKTPTSLDGYKKLLDKIHSGLSGDKSKAFEDGKAQARAELTTKGRLSLGGGSQGGSEGEPTIESLSKKYPNLSRDQIQQRLAEIQSLYPKK